jgi:hypothetical protein
MTETHLPTTTAAVHAAARRTAFRPVLILLWSFVGLSAAMVVFLAVLSAVGIGVDTAIWVRCSIVLGSSIVLLVFGIGAARGSRNALLRLRIVAPVVVAAVIVIVSIPGFLPGWVRVEQAVCGLIVLPVAIIANLPRTRALFRATA